MYSCNQLLQALKGGQCDAPLSAVYTAEGLDQTRARAVRVAQALADTFAPQGDAALFSGPGRTELGGNHTDHQHGRVLCASVDMDMLACAAPNGLNVIRVQSEGYPALEVDLSDLSPRPQEANTSAALVRGVAEGIAKRGYAVGGFDARAVSTVLSGSGLSSSAAYEILIGNIINHFFCQEKLDAVELAKIGQYAENVHFGKPCGLMDQMGSSVGGMVSIDFAGPAAPVIEKVDFDLAAAGYALCIIDTGADHADLTDEYAAVPAELKEICAHFGKAVLREVPALDFFAALPELRRECGDRAVLRTFTPPPPGRPGAGWGGPGPSAGPYIFPPKTTGWPERWVPCAGGISAPFCPWSTPPASPAGAISKTSSPPGTPAIRRWPWPWPWRNGRWTRRGPSGSTAAASPGPSRLSCPWSGWRSSRRRWSGSWARASATSSGSGPRAAASWRPEGLQNAFVKDFVKAERK